MQKKFCWLLLLSCLLSACGSTTTPRAVESPPLAAQTVEATQTVEPTLIVTQVGNETPTPFTIASFSDPDPETWVKVMPHVREYFYYRKKAVIAGSVEMLWTRYPELQQGIDVSNGINVEEKVVSLFQILNPFDGNIFPAFYEGIKVNSSDANIEILVHGMELYLCQYGSGFDDSGGEFRLILFFRTDGDQWTLYKTMAITVPRK